MSQDQQGQYKVRPVGDTVVDDGEISVNGKAYQVGSVIHAKRREEVTKSLYNALDALDLDRDGVIGEHEILQAARNLRDKKKEVFVLKKALLVMLLAVVMISAATFGVSLWANKLSKDVYTEGDTLTNADGMVLKTAPAYSRVDDIFSSIDDPWAAVARTVSLDFTVEGTQLHFKPSVITRSVDEDGQTVITFRANGDKVVLTPGKLTVTFVGEEPMVLTQRSNRGLDEEEVPQTMERNYDDYYF